MDYEKFNGEDRHSYHKKNKSKRIIFSGVLRTERLPNCAYKLCILARSWSIACFFSLFLFFISWIIFSVSIFARWFSFFCASSKQCDFSSQLPFSFIRCSRSVASQIACRLFSSLWDLSQLNHGSCLLFGGCTADLRAVSSSTRARFFWRSSSNSHRLIASFLSRIWLNPRLHHIRIRNNRYSVCRYVTKMDIS